MFKICCLVFLLPVFGISYGQLNDPISEQEAERIISILASDSLKGRGNGSPELHKAAFFIEKEFQKDSLDYFAGFSSYLQPFSLKDLSDDEKRKDSNGHFISPDVLFNVVGVLPGDSLPQEAIIFSAHYDHIGTIVNKKDSICNGANDDASGTTALLMLAHYFAQKRKNARTLIFCAFSGEELGLIGSGVFAKNLAPEHIVAGINLEMIGRTNATGRNAFFVTGESYSDLGRILRKNLKGTKFKIRSEPDSRKILFKRSDNYSLVLLGIPAHTIMCSDDDDECYHWPCDEVKRIDISNMTNIIRAIADATASIIDGRDTPRRINPRSIRY